MAMSLKIIYPFGEAVNINSCNPYYMPFLFTILFSRGTTGWHPKISFRAGEELRIFKAGEVIVGESTSSPEVSPVVPVTIDFRRPLTERQVEEVVDAFAAGDVVSYHFRASVELTPGDLGAGLAAVDDLPIAPPFIIAAAGAESAHELSQSGESSGEMSPSGESSNELTFEEAQLVSEAIPEMRQGLDWFFRRVSRQPPGATDAAGGSVPFVRPKRGTFCSLHLYNRHLMHERVGIAKLLFLAPSLLHWWVLELHTQAQDDQISFLSKPKNNFHNRRAAYDEVSHAVESGGDLY